VAEWAEELTVNETLKNEKNITGGEKHVRAHKQQSGEFSFWEVGFSSRGTLPRREMTASLKENNTCAG